MSTASRWRGKLAGRLGLLGRARRHNDLVHTAASHAILAKRKAQVAYARRVINRHSDAAPASGMSNRGVALVAGFEGFRANVYRDAVGVPTQGYGETHGITPGRSWSRAYALARLRTRLNRDYLPPVLALNLPRQGMIDALGSFVYNLGPGVIGPDTTLGKALRRRDWTAAANALLAYDHAGGRRLPGLTARRRAERALFLSR